MANRDTSGARRRWPPGSKGGQIRGYLNLNDTLQCVQLAAEKPAGAGELRILNQFTETFSVNDLADRVQRAGKLVGLQVTVENIDNPRKEPEEHYYNPAHSGLLELGLQPHLMSDDVLAAMLEIIKQHADAIDRRMIFPRVRWKS